MIKILMCKFSLMSVYIKTFKSSFSSFNSGLIHKVFNRVKIITRLLNHLKEEPGWL